MLVHKVCSMQDSQEAEDFDDLGTKSRTQNQRQLPLMTEGSRTGSGVLDDS